MATSAVDYYPTSKHRKGWAVLDLSNIESSIQTPVKVGETLIVGGQLGSENELARLYLVSDLLVAYDVADAS